jgi:hypothetical protein
MIVFVQLVLTLFFLIVLLAAISLLRGSRILAMVLFSCALGAVVLVWYPDLATEIANLLGVGRGADLLLYIWFAVSGVLLLGAYLRIRRLSEELTELVRAVALMQAGRDHRQ